MIVPEVAPKCRVDPKTMLFTTVTPEIDIFGQSVPQSVRGSHTLIVLMGARMQNGVKVQFAAANLVGDSPIPQ